MRPSLTEEARVIVTWCISADHDSGVLYERSVLFIYMSGMCDDLAGYIDAARYVVRQPGHPLHQTLPRHRATCLDLPVPLFEDLVVEVEGLGDLLFRLRPHEILF